MCEKKLISKVDRVLCYNSDPLFFSSHFFDFEHFFKKFNGVYLVQNFMLRKIPLHNFFDLLVKKVNTDKELCEGSPILVQSLPDGILKISFQIWTQQVHFNQSPSVSWDF